MKSLPGSRLSRGPPVADLASRPLGQDGRESSLRGLHLTLLLLVVFLAFIPSIAFAQYSSTNYQSNEVFFGIGGDLDASSTNYQAQSSAGALGVGYFSST